MIPFRSSAGTGPQDTLILVDVTSLIVTSCGGPLGSESKENSSQNLSRRLTFYGKQTEERTTKGDSFLKKLWCCLGGRV